MTKIIIPEEVLNILNRLNSADFEAYIVGGCVRDLLLNKKPKDWDIATNAIPQEIQKIFPKSVYENQFGTVAIKTPSKDSSLEIIEITTFRKEGKYTDKRHPDSITFAKTIEEDLARRDFTINAIAAAATAPKLKIIDPFAGQEDLKNKIIRAVGVPKERFREDALRLMRAIRFACELDFKIEQKTEKAIKENAPFIRFIAKERIKDELIKTIQTKEAAKGILLLQKTGLLKYIIPELEKGVGITQNKHHIYTVWEHLWRSLDYAAKKNYSLEVRFAALFHDISKPETKQGQGENATFYNHEWKGEKLANQILTNLKFPKRQAEKIIKFVRYHGFVYDPEITTDSAIRRLLIKVGKENIQELAQVREADRIGSGCPKAVPFRLRHFLFRMEKALKEMEGQQPSLKMLKINGGDIMKILNIKPGPKIGMLLNLLLEEILDNPEKNEKEILKKRIGELEKLSDGELKKLSEKAKEKYKNLLAEEERKIKEKYWV